MQNRNETKSLKPTHLSNFLKQIADLGLNNIHVKQTGWAGNSYL